MSHQAESDSRALKIWLSQNRALRTGNVSTVFPQPDHIDHKNPSVEEATNLWRMYRQIFPRGYIISCKEFQLLKDRCIALCSLLSLSAWPIIMKSDTPNHESIDILCELQNCIEQLDNKDDLPSGYVSIPAIL